MNKNYSNVEIKTDCFAYRPERIRINPCSALDDLYCKCEICSFYKTKEQFDAEIEKYGWFQK